MMLRLCSNEYTEPALILEAISLLFHSLIEVVLSADELGFDAHEVETEP